MLTIPAVTIRRPPVPEEGIEGQQTTIDLNLVVAKSDHRLSYAFTNSTAVWVLPEDPAVTFDTEQEVRGGGIGNLIETIGTRAVHLTVPQVLGTAWLFGVVPSGPGQIVVRPRLVSFSRTSPPAGPGGRTDPGIYWVVEERGRIVESRAGEAGLPAYYSARVILISDEDPRKTRGVLLP